MALVIEAIAADGVVTRTPVETAGEFRLAAQPGVQYRIVNDRGQPVGGEPRVVQLDGDLVIEALPDNQVIVLDGFFTACTPETSCSLSLEELGGGPNETITPATEPVAALTEGGYLMNQATGNRELPREPGSELNWKPIAAGAGGLVVLLGAAGGSGGDGDGGIDTTPPAAPTLDTSSVGSGTPVLSGTGEPDSTVFVVIDVGSTGNTVSYSTGVAASGQWSIDLASAAPIAGTLPAGGLPAGSTSAITLQAADAANNVSGVVNENVVHDNTPPDAVATVTGAEDDVEPGTGALASGDITNDASPTITGTLSSALLTGEFVQVFRDGTLLGQAEVSGQAWSFQDSGAGQGSHVYTARTIDSAGNATAQSAGFTLQIDTTGSTTTADITAITDDLPPDVGPVANNGITNDGTPSLTGTLSDALLPGESLQILRNGDIAGNAVVSGTGWSFDESPLPDGQYAYVARVVDVAGNPGPDSATYQIEIDSTNPDASATVTGAEDNVAPQVGALVNADTTNDNELLINGTLNEALGAGESVQVLRDGGVIGNAVVSGLAWTFQDAAIADGTYVYTARTIDAVGNAGSPSGAFQLVVDTTAPLATVAIPNATDNVGLVQGALNNGDATDDTQPRINGTLSQALASGETLQVLLDGSVVETLTPAGTAWNYTPGAALAAGSHTFSARIIDAAGNVGPTASLDLTVDLTAPTQPVSIVEAVDDAGTVTGPLASGASTDDVRPVLNGTVGAGLAGTDQIQILLDGALLGQASRSGTSWTYSSTADVADGSHVYTARVIDAAGNIGNTATFNLTVDTTGPATTSSIDSATDDVAPQVGSLASGATTNDTAPALSGTLSTALAAGETVEVTRVTVGTANSDVTNLATISVGQTAWTYDDSGLASGETYRYTARVVDNVGNAGASSAPFDLTISTGGPTTTASINTATDDVGSITGALNDSDATDDTQPVLNGTLSQALGAGESLEILLDGSVVDTQTPAGTTWTYAVTPALTDGSYTFSARVVDGAGNLGAAGTFDLTIDTTASAAVPSIDDATDDVGSSTGTLITGDTTDDTQPVINGSLAQALAGGETLEILLDGAVVDTQTPAGTSFTYAVTPALADGSYTFGARVVDAVGNQTAVSTFDLTIDAAASAAVPTIVDAADDAGSITGTLNSGDATDDDQPVLNGTLAQALGAGDSLEILLDGVVVDTQTPAGTTFTYAVTPALTDGSYTFGARVVDSVGNQTTTSTFDLTIDTTASAAVPTLVDADDDVGSITATLNSGDATDDTQPVVNGTLTQALAAGDSLEILLDGVVVDTQTPAGTTFTYAVTPALTDGSYTFGARVVDAVGNPTATATFDLTIDATAPTTAADVTDVIDDQPTTVGSIADGGQTNDTTPEIQITLDTAIAAGETVNVLRDGVSVGTASGAGTAFTFTDSGLTPATYIYTAQVIDAVGNEAPVGTAYSIEFINDPSAVDPGSVASTSSAQLTLADLFSVGEGGDLAGTSGIGSVALGTDGSDLTSLLPRDPMNGMA